MKKFLLMMFTMLMGLQSVQAMNVDEFIDKNIAPVTDAIANVVFTSVSICGTKVPLIILWILVSWMVITRMRLSNESTFVAFSIAALCV